jgi:nucleoside-diphosphate-sugar epimerase
MRVFVTGATGYVGSAVAAALLEAGHTVTGAGRNAAKAQPLVAQGMTFSKMELGDVAGLTQAAKEHDATVHAASDMGPQRVDVERAAVDALLEGARAAGAQLIYTSGIWVLGPTGAGKADEKAATNPLPLVAWRPAMEQRVLSARSDSVRAWVIRPGVVWGGSAGILSEWWAGAVDKKAFRIVGDGKNRWPMVHRDDLAQLYRRVLEQAAAPSILHATDDTAHSVAELASAVAKATGATVTMWPLAEARSKLGPYADALAADQHVVSPAARALGWAPRHLDFTSEAKLALEEFRAAAPSP